MKTDCMITMDGQETTSEDFIAILAKPDGTASVFFNTDALTVGMGIKLLATEFVAMMSQCTDEEQKELTSILGSSFFTEASKINA